MNNMMKQFFLIFMIPNSINYCSDVGKQKKLQIGSKISATEHQVDPWGTCYTSSKSFFAVNNTSGDTLIYDRIKNYQAISSLPKEDKSVTQYMCILLDTYCISACRKDKTIDGDDYFMIRKMVDGTVSRKIKLPESSLVFKSLCDIHEMPCKPGSFMFNHNHVVQIMDAMTESVTHHITSPSPCTITRAMPDNTGNGIWYQTYKDIHCNKIAIEYYDLRAAKSSCIGEFDGTPDCLSVNPSDSLCAVNYNNTVHVFDTKMRNTQHRLFSSAESAPMTTSFFIDDTTLLYNTCTPVEGGFVQNRNHKLHVRSLTTNDHLHTAVLDPIIDYLTYHPHTKLLVASRYCRGLTLYEFDSKL